jgi:hypothetical protein
MLALAGLTALILGFLTKRMMIPSAVHYIAYRPHEQPQSVSESNPATATENQSAPNDSASSNAKSDANEHGTSENLTPSDSRALDVLIKRKDR